VLCVLLAYESFAQPSGNCDPITPFFNCNLTGNPNGTWVSAPPVPRAGNCCGTLPPDKCVEFLITLDSQAVAINFAIASGAVPPGALFYQINCGPPVAVGQPLCLNGPGPYSLTFCKPGNNINTYAITSVGAPTVSPDDTIANGCSTTMYASGLLVDNSITWSSVAPGSPGQYNSYLSCTQGCDSTVVTAQPGAPPFVDYVVCGTPLAGACAPTQTFCDTIRIYFTPAIINPVNPNPAIFCANNPSGVVLTGSVSGGVPPYTYAWTNGANGSGTVVGSGTTYTATAGGSYSFIVYDQNYPTCPPQITTVTVTVSPTPTITAGPDQTLCGTQVQLSGSVGGATGGIWTGGAGTFSPNNTSPNAVYTPTPAELSAGTIVLSFTSTGNGACSAVSDQVVINISPPLSVSITAPPVLCFGQTTSLTANVSGGLGPFIYQWNTGQTSQTISNVVGGGYNVTVTGAGTGCVATASVNIVQNPQIIVNTSPNNQISCATTATISATANGGTAPLSYQWSNGATGQSTVVNTGTYVVTVTDTYGCTATNTVSVQASNSTLNVTLNQPPVLCNGATTTLNANATGGFGGYTYSWTNGSTTNSTVAGAGNQCVTVTDAGGCVTQACVVITQNPALTVNIPAPSTVCNGASTTISGFANGGQPPYSYSWSTGQLSQSITAPAGNYTITVSDAIGCTSSASVTISQAAAVSAAPTATAVTCFGGSNGLASANASGGTPGYYYSWSPYGGSGATATGLMAGTFTVTVTDALGCAISQTVAVTQPLAISATVTVNNNVGCFGGSNGSATVNSSGGTPAYFYSWSPYGGNAQTASNLGAGTFTVTITDIYGCMQKAQTVITQPAILTGSVSATSNVSCNGGANGSGTVAGSGGTPGYTYAWSPSGATTATANNLAAGTHTATITDANGCTTQVLVTINQPTPLSASVSTSNNVSCNGGNNGSATVSAAGGTGPYTYSWNTNPVQTTATATNLGIGTYVATVTDSKGCVVSANSVTITQPPVLTVSATPTSSISCNSTIIISASASGGSGSYFYSWNTGSTNDSITVGTGTYSVTVTDGAGCNAGTTVSVQASNSTLSSSITPPATLCNGASTTLTMNASGGFGGYSYLWSTGATSTSIITVAGNYCCTVTDGGGCQTTACVTVNQNPPVTASIGTPQNVCPGGTTTITASGGGGQAPYSYLWNTGQTTASVVQPQGTYTVTVSDATGTSCSATATVTISQSPTMTLSLGSTNVGCFGSANGTASVYASGGMPGYTYSWTPAGGTNATASNLGPGNYTVTVTDAIGCTKTGNVSISQPPSAVSALASSTNILCFGQANGTASASGSGGYSPYYYYWSNNGASTSSITGLAPGVYSVTVADSSGCYALATTTVTSPSDISLSYTTSAASCGTNNGSATVMPTGGAGAYTYTWAPVGGNGATASSLAAGNYTVTVKDGNGCQKQLVVTVPSTSSVVNANFAASTACLNTVTTYTDLSTANNDVIVAWNWNFGESSSGSSNVSSLQNPSHTYSSAGTFTSSLVVTTQMGCADTIFVAVTVNPLPVISFTWSTGCSGVTTFSNSSSISGGTITNWSWNFGDPNSGPLNISNLQNPSHAYGVSGAYQVLLTATSNNGCIGTLTQNLTVPSIPVAAFVVQNGCKNSPTLFVDSSQVQNGTITGWAWDFGDGTAPSSSSNPTHTYTNNATYTVTLIVTSNFGCMDTISQAVTIYPAAVANFSAANVCVGSPTQFTDLSTVPFGNINSWAWDFGDFSAPANSQNPSHTYAVPGTFVVTLSVTSSNGCAASIAQPVNVYAIPVASFLGNNGCLNANTQFTDQSTVSNDTIGSWLWSFGDGSPVSSLQHPSHTYLSSGSYTVSLVVSSIHGCIDTVSAPVQIYSIPVAAFSVNDSNGCANYCPQFNDLSTTVDGMIVNWSWSFGDGTNTGITQNPQHCFPSTGLYSITLTVTTSNGCTDTLTQVNFIEVYPVPNADFTYNPLTITNLSPEINFIDMSDTSVWAWNWFFDDPNDPAISLLQNPQHSYSDTGTYCVQLIVENIYHCTDTAIRCLRINPEFTFYIPNAFTPGTSFGKNDGFGGAGTFIKEFQMWIFDRWGNQVFYSADLYEKWDGRPQGSKTIAQEDVYVYKIELYDVFGELHKYSGIINLIR
jgi:large repetitive protein